MTNNTAGNRVVLVRMADDPRPVPPGTKGTVMFVDGLGTVHVRWDDGRRLGLVPGVDEWATETGGESR